MPTDVKQSGDSGVEPVPAEVPYYSIITKRSPSPNFLDTKPITPHPFHPTPYILFGPISPSAPSTSDNIYIW